MSLQYKTQVYIRKAIRQAFFHSSASGVWSASLPAFGLEATGESKDDAEQNLMIELTVYVLSAPQLGWPLPTIEGIDVTEGAAVSIAHEMEAEDVAAPEALTLTTRESAMVAQALEHPPQPNEYLLNAARAYRDFMSQ